MTRVAPGLTAIAGGKLTIYRVMAQDAVDHTLGDELATARPTRTTTLPLVGANGYRERAGHAEELASTRGWPLTRVTHLLDRYGSETPALLAAADEHDAELAVGARELAWGQPLTGAPDFLRAEVAWADHDVHGLLFRRMSGGWPGGLSGPDGAGHPGGDARPRPGRRRPW